MFTSFTKKAFLAGFAALALSAALPAAATTVSSTINVGDVSNLSPFSVSYGSTINPTTRASALLGVSANTYSSFLGGVSSSSAVSSTSAVSFSSGYEFSLSGNFYESANLILGTNSTLSGVTFNLYKVTSTGALVSDPSVWVTANDTKVSGYLTTGTYELVVSGVSAAGKVSSFSGNLAISQAPIPAALPLFGSALVVVGFLGRRRQRAKVA